MILFDTNILTYSLCEYQREYKTCRDWIERVRSGEIDGVVSSQNITEFCSNMLALIDLNKIGKRVDVVEAVGRFNEIFSNKIYPNKRTIDVLLKLLKGNRTSKRRVFDMFLAATMISNGVEEILTYNTKDFEHFKGIKAIRPE